MSPTNALVALMVLALWFVLMSSWRLRNWRATGLAVVATGAIAAAGLLPYPLSPVARGGLWAATLWIFLLRSDVVAVMAPSESDFVEELVRILQSIRRLQGTIGKNDPATYVAQFESAVRRLEQLEAPPAWIEVKADMAGELRRRLVMMKLADPPDEAQRVGEDPWLAIEPEFAAKLRERAGFWNGWPVPISRFGRR